MAIGEPLDGLADDLELASDGILAHSLGHERVAAYRRVNLDVIDGVADVTEVDALVLHNGRDSAKMRSRSAGCKLAGQHVDLAIEEPKAGELAERVGFVPRATREWQ